MLTTLKKQEAKILKNRHDIDPPVFYECDDFRKRVNEVVKNIRAVLQLFDIRVFVYSDRVEIRGAIPPQLLGMNNVKESSPAPIISSGRGRPRG
jgi:hypothetical protein